MRLSSRALKFKAANQVRQNWLICEVHLGYPLQSCRNGQPIPFDCGWREILIMNRNKKLPKLIYIRIEGIHLLSDTPIQPRFPQIIIELVGGRSFWWIDSSGNWSRNAWWLHTLLHSSQACKQNIPGVGCRNHDTCWNRRSLSRGRYIGGAIRSDMSIGNHDTLPFVFSLEMEESKES